MKCTMCLFYSHVVVFVPGGGHLTVKSGTRIGHLNATLAWEGVGGAGI